MSLEACPTCGYAVSTVDHQCRHCAGASRTVVPLKKLDVRGITNAIVIASIVSAIVYWAFFAQ